MNVTETKKKIVEALDEVSKKLGNTRTVCKKYYVHPGLIGLYEQNKLAALITTATANQTRNWEKVLLQILKKCL